MALSSSRERVSMLTFFSSASLTQAPLDCFRFKKIQMIQNIRNEFEKSNATNL
jgi:hypothetical protein